MSKTIAKGRLYSVTVEVSDERLKAIKDAPDATEKAMMAGADYWHSRILPEHFQRSAHAKYDYADRTRKYRMYRKRGRPDLVYSGAMASDLMSRASFQRVGQGVNLKMYARALNFAPSMPQNSSDHYVTHTSRGRKRRARYPNMKREIRAFNEADREAVAAVVAAELEHLFSPTDAGGKASAFAPAPTTAS